MKYYLYLDMCYTQERISMTFLWKNRLPKYVSLKLLLPDVLGMFLEFQHSSFPSLDLIYHIWCLLSAFQKPPIVSTYFLPSLYYSWTLCKMLPEKTGSTTAKMPALKCTKYSGPGLLSDLQDQENSLEGNTCSSSGNLSKSTTRIMRNEGDPDLDVESALPPSSALPW